MQKKGNNQADLLDSNRSYIMKYLVKNPGCSRAEIAEEAGLTLASLTKIMRSLTESGIVYETGFSEGKKGRRSIGLSFDYTKFKVLAIKISWDLIEIQPYDFTGMTFGKRSSIEIKNLSFDNIDKILKIVINNVHHFQQIFPEIAAIGIAVPGPYFRDTGTILLPPYNKNIKLRNYYSIKDEIEKHTNLPLFIEHDADVGALAYWWFNATAEKNKVVMNIFTNVGIGIGLTENGKIYTGTSNSSCETGHITLNCEGRYCSRCGSFGCMESYCSSTSLVEMAIEGRDEYHNSRLNLLPTITAEKIIEEANKKDEFAQKLIFECGEYMGYGIHSLLHIFNPDIIVISGVISASGSRLLDGIYASLSKRQSSFIIVPDIKLIPFEQNLTLLGAATFAMDNMLSSPTKYFSLPSTN